MGSASWSPLEFITFTIALLFFVTASVISGGWGLLHGSRSALGLSLALLLPAAFFLIFQPILSYFNELPFWLGRYILLISVALAPLIAAIGVGKQSRTSLLMSASLAVPAGVWFFFYPGTRYYLALPFIHLIAAAIVRTPIWWLSWLVLVVILGFGIHSW